MLVGGETKRCIVLHDLYIDLARYLAETTSGCLKDTAKRVLQSYVPDKIGTISEERPISEAAGAGSSAKMKNPFLCKASSIFRRGKQKSKINETTSSERTKNTYEGKAFHELWISVKDDAFVLQNLFRLLRITGMNTVGTALLSDPRWIEKQMKACGWKQVDTEFMETLNDVEKVVPRAGRAINKEDDDIETFLLMVRGALSECERYVVNSDEAGMLQTQLYGRLYHYRAYRRITEFLENVEESATVVWVKSQCAFPAPVASSGKVLDIGDVRLARHGKSGVEIVDFDNGDLSFRLHKYSIADDVLTDSISDWKMPMEYNNLCSHLQVGLSQDCKTFLATKGHVFLIFDDSGRRNGSSYNLSTTLSMPVQTIVSFAMTKNGCNIVTGDGVGKLMFWKKTEGKWESSQIGTHKQEVRAIAIDDNGTHIASGSSGGAAFLWKFDGHSWTSLVLQGEKKMRCCAFSGCGTFLVTWSWDRKVRVWTEEPSGWKGNALIGTFGDVYAIDISDDKNVIVGGSAWNVVVFERHGEQWTHNILQGHSRPVTSVSISEGKRKVVSASRFDGTVSVSDVRVAHWKKSDIEGHEYGVRAVAVGTDRVLSGDVFGNVIVWDLSDGEWANKKTIRVSGLVEGIHLDDSSHYFTVRISGEKFDSYVERNGEWEADLTTDLKQIVWAESVPLEVEKWPLGLGIMRYDWNELYAVPGGEWFAVKLRHEPWFDIVQLVQRR